MSDQRVGTHAARLRRRQRVQRTTMEPKSHVVPFTRLTAPSSSVTTMPTLPTSTCTRPMLASGNTHDASAVSCYTEQGGAHTQPHAHNPTQARYPTHPAGLVTPGMSFSSGTDTRNDASLSTGPAWSQHGRSHGVRLRCHRPRRIANATLRTFPKNRLASNAWHDGLGEGQDITPSARRATS